MDNFYHYEVFRQNLNVRAAHSLCRAGWMLREINGVLQTGQIRPENFHSIQQKAVAFVQLQNQFGPPPALTSSTDTQTFDVDTSKLPTIRVMNRGVDAAAAVLRHHGWKCSQIRHVLKPSDSLLNNLSYRLIRDRGAQSDSSFRLPLFSSKSKITLHRKAFSACKRFAILLFLGIGFFLGASLIIHMLRT